MPEPNGNSRRDYSAFDNMSTRALEDILQADFQLPNNEDSDVDAVLYIMEVIAKREKEQSTRRFTDSDVAWESFNENYRPYTGDGKSLYDEDINAAVSNGIETEPLTSAGRKKPKRSRRRLIRIAFVTAVIFTIVFAGSITANALGCDLWKAIAQWTRDTFGFNASDLAREENSPLGLGGEYNSLHDALDDFSITDDLAPVWIPDGYTLYSLDITESPVKRVFFALYKKDNEDLTISITNISSGTISTFEKDATDVTVYNTAEIDHYIMSNNNWLKAVWLNNNYECYISGRISQDDLIHMIESIYER